MEMVGVNGTRWTWGGAALEVTNNKKTSGKSPQTRGSLRFTENQGSGQLIEAVKK